MNGIDIVLILAIALAVILALRRIHRTRKNGCSCGSSGCTGNCASCGASCARRD